MISATIRPCAMARCASIGSPARSPTAQTLRIEVAQRVVDPDERPVHGQVEPSSPKPVVQGRRPTVTRMVSAGIARSAPSAAGDPQRRAIRRQAARLGGGQHRDAQALHPAQHRARQLGVPARQDAVGGLDHRDRGAELGEGHAELEPDIAGADHRQALRHARQRQRLGRGDHVAAEGQRRQRHRLRAGRQQHVLGADGLRPGIGLDAAGLAVEHDAAPLHASAPCPASAAWRRRRSAGRRCRPSRRRPGRSRGSAAATRSPKGEACACPAARPNSAATWISAFDGMQPTIRQVPPRLACSTSTVSRPSCPARIAAM